MKSVQWKTYRTRFLVQAKQLNSNLSFTDHLGRQHCGRKGDYLVESCDGVLSITPRRIFEDIYVAMLSPNPSRRRANEDEEENAASDSRQNLRFASLRIGTLEVEKIKSKVGNGSYESIDLEKTPRTSRKCPQPVRVSSSRLELM